MADEMGGKEGWKIEKCFLIEDSREVADIIHGDFFIARSNIADEKYDSLTVPTTPARQRRSNPFRLPLPQDWRNSILKA